MLALQRSGRPVVGRSPAPATAFINQLLARMSQALRASLAEHLELVRLPAARVLYEAGDTPGHVYFPEDAIVSLLHRLEDGGCAEVAIIGNDGMVGIAPFMGGGGTWSSAVVYSAGNVYRLPVAILKRACSEYPELEGLLLLYTQALITQMAQMAGCNRHHSVQQQLARFLLMSIDRLPVERLQMTQEAIAHLMGVRREGVTTAAGRLQRRGLIEYRRGRILILNRPGLEKESCECYQVVRRETERLLPSR